VRAVLVTAAAAAVALTLGGCVAEEAASTQPVNDGFTPAEVAETPSEEAGSAADGTCEYQEDPASASSSVGLPPEEPVEATSLALTTSAGPITVQLDAEAAPCTVRSMAFLAGAGFFNETTCHRLTVAETLKVLQCGDPNGDGTGGPGYSVPDELEAAEALEPGAEGRVTYPRGIVAMANAGPGTTGSQFFLVYGDSTLPPDYAVIGSIDEAGLATLDQIAAAGINPGSQSPDDGAPKTPVTITTAVAS
jgi:peptidyl-prolyl cis-trans isomerase B (cyclophilin B)